ncbi:tyrosine--tRNA ligase [Methanomassiliicoccus luminyensis]|uniref:tyrosine--tRNA ligase n=1 Tax=Methanomassiliicoccus luminyensis TaxID=1080712 RepID=UPI000365C4D0|nr:tyrosine--tRNA ligase [Methanomassiliicoccus luminyensis]
MDIEERYELLARNTEEIVTADELRGLLAKDVAPKAYIGFEPSGLVHLGWVVCANKIRDFVDAGFEMTIFFADWHAYINDKLGGDIERIRLCALYMQDCFEALGVPRDKVKFVMASEIMDGIGYWEKVMKVGKVTSLSRIKRSMTIMGRKEDDAELDSSKFLYPLMQATDLFMMDIDVAYAGIDQRRVHMLAREAAEKLHWKVPIALHTPLLPGLKGVNRMDPIATKMSKSDPDSGISIHDSPEDINRKIKKAFCPEKEVEGNPMMAICKHILFQESSDFVIDRPEKFGGKLVFHSYDELASAYAGGDLHPVDLKQGVAKGLIDKLAPVRAYFEKNHQNLDALKRSLGIA